MQVFKVSRSSWHYKVYDQFDWSLPKDFCTYWRRVILGSLFLVGIIGFVCVLLFMLANLLYMLALALIANPVPILKLIGVVVAAFAGLAFTWWAAYKVNKKVFYGTDSDKQPSIVVAKYRSWKHKYCPAIEYTE